MSAFSLFKSDCAQLYREKLNCNYLRVAVYREKYGR